MHEAHDRRNCPFFHGNEARCAERFTLSRMSEVFEFCLGRHERCDIYQDLMIDEHLLNRPRLAQAV
jgi:hypothetical protein